MHLDVRGDDQIQNHKREDQIRKGRVVLLHGVRAEIVDQPAAEHGHSSPADGRPTPLLAEVVGLLCGQEKRVQSVVYRWRRRRRAGRQSVPSPPYRLGPDK